MSNFASVNFADDSLSRKTVAPTWPSGFRNRPLSFDLRLLKRNASASRYRKRAKDSTLIVRAPDAPLGSSPARTLGRCPSRDIWHDRFTLMHLFDNHVGPMPRVHRRASEALLEGLRPEEHTSELQSQS